VNLTYILLGSLGLVLLMHAVVRFLDRPEPIEALSKAELLKRIRERRNL
jgi:hypothetical protein